MRTSPTGRPMPSVHGLLDPRDAGVEWPEYQQLRDKFINLKGQADETNKALRDHLGRRRSAEQADREAYAAALKAGKSDPGQKNVDE